MPAKEHPPLPDVVQAMSLLDDNDGVINEDDLKDTTLKAMEQNGAEGSIIVFCVFHTKVFADGAIVPKDMCFHFKANRRSGFSYGTSCKCSCFFLSKKTCSNF